MQPDIGEEAEVRTEVEVCTDEGYFLYSAVAANVSLQRMLLIQLLLDGQMMFVFFNNSKNIKKTNMNAICLHVLDTVFHFSPFFCS